MSQAAATRYPALKLTPAQQLPPLGPPWWGAVMGTGILASLLQAYAGTTATGQIAARSILTIAWITAIIWAVTHIRNIIKNPASFKASLTALALPAWGMVAMGLLSLGSATFNVLPAWVATQVAKNIAIEIDIILWTGGTILGLIVAFGFTINLLKHRPDEPRPAWALAVVPPMVSATTGTSLDALLPTPLRAALLTCLMGCFCVTLTLAFIVLYAALDHHLRISVIPAQLAVTSFIPLGPVGQSTAAANAIAGQAHTMLVPDAIPTVHAFANTYGSIMLLVSAPLIALAYRTVLRAIKDGLTFNPTWWASTFPIGTVALGAHYLSQQPGFEAVRWYGALILALLCINWVICAAATAKALLAKN